jgi:hypothetical protein
MHLMFNDGVASLFKILTYSLYAAFFNMLHMTPNGVSRLVIERGLHF